MASRAFVVSGSDPSRAAPIIRSLKASGLSYDIFTRSGEPDFADLRSCLRAAREFIENPGDTVIIGIGGGSSLDLAKACGMLLNNPGDPLEYAEIVGSGKSFVNPSVPVIAIPTTAGSGSEATRNAVIAHRGHGAVQRGIKVSLRSPLMLPRFAIIDPELAYTLPPNATACGGMDALTQVLEPYVSVKANAMCDSICKSALGLLAHALPPAVAATRSGISPDAMARKARADMAYIALCGGLALANSGLGAVHGIAAPLGGVFNIPHGAACARLLSPVCQANIRALREREPDNPALARYRQIAAMFSGDASARAEDLGALLESLAAEIGIKALSSFDADESAIPDLVAAAQNSNSMKGNPIKLTDSEIGRIIRVAL